MDAEHQDQAQMAQAHAQAQAHSAQQLAQSQQERLSQQQSMQGVLDQANSRVQSQHDEIAELKQAARVTAAATQGSTHNMPRGYKPEGTARYHGRTGEDIESWLFQLEEQNRLFPIENELQRIRYTALSLRETAAKWYSSMQMSDPPQITDWESFTTKLRQQFVHLDQKWVARNTLHALKQVGNVRDYSVKFRNLLILIPDMSAADALDKYIRGLKDFSWKVWRRKFVNLEEAMVYAEELDLEVQQKSILTGRGDPVKKRADGLYGAVATRHVAWQPRAAPRAIAHGGPTPMELGVLRMNETERNRHMAQDLCFTCHKPGHRSNACPSKTKSGNVGRRK
jgi:hypothetical protein